MAIQVALLGAVVSFLVLFIRSRHGVRMQASKRMAFFAFLLLNVYAILRPEDVTRLAHLLGVGRGTDLLLYLLIVTFVFTMINFYLWTRETERRLTELTRALAIHEAMTPASRESPAQ